MRTIDTHVHRCVERIGIASEDGSNCSRRQDCISLRASKAVDSLMHSHSTAPSVAEKRQVLSGPAAPGRLGAT